MKISLLNHASIIVEINGFKLLTDPWYFGTAFNGGWGLRFENPEAIEHVSSCTHLWISHFHQDHFHIPTLKKILEIHPEIIVLGNHSHNFQLDNAMRGVGFPNVLTMPERKPVNINERLSLTRYPTTGIDNMLLIESDEGVILNYNDCVLPDNSQRWLVKKFGPVDVFLSNFNHAGKLLRYPMDTGEEIKAELRDNFRNYIAAFNPRWVIPFASYHYYRSPDNLQQNESLNELEDLLPIDQRIIPVHIGEQVIFDQKFEDYRVEPQSNSVSKSVYGVVEQGASKSWEEIVSAAEKYCKKIRSGFPIFYHFLPVLKIHIYDLDINAQVHPRKGIVQDTASQATSESHIQVHSEALFNWFDHPFGTDTFVVGAHFRISNTYIIPLRWQFIFSLLTENGIDLKSLVRMLFSISGIRFIWHRREEIMGVLTSGQIGPVYQQEKK